MRVMFQRELPKHRLELHAVPDGHQGHAVVHEHLVNVRMMILRAQSDYSCRNACSLHVPCISEPATTRCCCARRTSSRDHRPSPFASNRARSTSCKSSRYQAATAIAPSSITGTNTRCAHKHYNCRRCCSSPSLTCDRSLSLFAIFPAMKSLQQPLVRKRKVAWRGRNASREGGLRVRAHM